MNRRQGNGSSRKRGGKYSHKGRANAGRKFGQERGHTGTLSRTLIAPDELDVKLRYRSFGNIGDGAAALKYKEWTPNSAYDVDPAFGSTETYGFDEYAALYSYYRVIGYSYRLTVTNNIALPMMVYVTNTNIQVSTAGSRWDLYTTNPYSQSKLVSSIGASTATAKFRGSFAVAKILGSGATETDDNYRALTTASPADLIWLGLAVENTTTNTTIDFSYDLLVTMKVRFYAREVDLSLAGLASRVEARLAARVDLMAKKWQKEQDRIMSSYEGTELDRRLKAHLVKRDGWSAGLSIAKKALELKAEVEKCQALSSTGPLCRQDQ